MKRKPVPEGYLFSKGYTHYIFILLYLLYFFDYVDRMVVAALFPFLKRDWGLTDAQCGTLVAAVYWSILLFSFPVSIVIDRWSRKRAIGIMAVLWSLATVACAFTKNFTQLFAARTAIGLGEAGYAPGGTAMISALYPEKKRSLLIGIWNSSIPIGMAFGLVAGGYIATHWGWRHAFGIVALPGLLISILFFFVRDYKTVGLEQSVRNGLSPAASAPKRKMSKIDIVREFTRTPSLLLTYLGFAGMMFVSTSLSTFFPTYFVRVQGVPLQKATVLTSGIMLVCIIGSPLGGWLADWWMKWRIQSRLYVAAIAAILTALFNFSGFHFFQGGTLQYALFMLGAIASIAYASSAIAVTQDVVHPGLRAVSYALCVVTQHLLGSAIGPVVTGALSDRYGISTAVQIASLFAISSCIFFSLASRFYARDLAKVEKIKLTAEDQPIGRAVPEPQA
ncbi:MAG TPA: MFS transporter [Thermodesulfobacteriota bacterium]|nr:MFS transporter [Thermodesulfobacteriota bacterium]